MKNTLKVDFSNNLIIMDRTFAKLCEDTNSGEYAKLQSVRKDYPDFKVLTRTIKRNPDKNTYKGLTYAYMEKYILNSGNDDEVKEALSEYRKLREIGECHKGKSYPVIKKWFLERYPEIENFRAAS